MANAADQLRATLSQAFESMRWIVEGLTDDEYFNEPVTRCWSVRRRADAGPGWGTGDWICEDAWPQPDPLPVTTIAWRLVHTCAWTDVYRDWTFGDAKLRLADIEVAGSAGDALDWLGDSQEDFAAHVASLTDTELDDVRPAHWGALLPIGDLVGSIAVEHIHHGAEIGVLRDLYRGSARIQPLP